jgi:hypothetical protein
MIIPACVTGIIIADVMEHNPDKYGPGTGQIIVAPNPWALYYWIYYLYISLARPAKNNCIIQRRTPARIRAPVSSGPLDDTGLSEYGASVAGFGS